MKIFLLFDSKFLTENFFIPSMKEERGEFSENFPERFLEREAKKEQTLETKEGELEEELEENCFTIKLENKLKN